MIKDRQNVFIVEDKGNLKKLKKELEKVNKKLESHFKKDSLVDPIYRQYHEDNEIGFLLRKRDKIGLRIYEIENNIELENFDFNGDAFEDYEPSEEEKN